MSECVWTHNSLLYILGASIFMTNLQFRSKLILNFIFLSNKLLSPRSIHAIFFLSTLHEILRLWFFLSRRFFCFELVFDSIDSYFYGSLSLSLLHFHLYYWMKRHSVNCWFFSFDCKQYRFDLRRKKLTRLCIFIYAKLWSVKLSQWQREKTSQH